MSNSDLSENVSEKDSRGSKVPCHHREDCRLCNSKRVELVVPLAPTLLAENYFSADETDDSSDLYPVDLYMCLDCGHVQILDVIPSEDLWSGYTYHSGQTQGILDHFEEISEKIVQKNDLKEGFFAIDIGSNDGSLLRCFKKRGLKVLGIDPAREIAQKATESGIETIPELLSLELASRVAEERGTASLVTAFNVFAHADDMQGMASSIQALLAPGGVFVFEVSYLMDIVDNFLLGAIFHEHLGHHSLIPMVSFLDRHGMELIDVERVSIQGGSIVGTAQLKGGPRKVMDAVAELDALERERGFDKPPAVRVFSDRLETLKKEVNVHLANWKKSGATIAGYGAARSGPTLMAQFSLGGVIEYLFDDHFQKVNKFTSGDRIPVIPTEELMERKPDYVFIFAWIHAKKIIRKHQDYLDAGGHFVLFCPDVKIIGKAEAEQL